LASKRAGFTDGLKRGVGGNPKKLERLQKRYFKPFGARLAKIPLGRKEHNDLVERSHCTDDAAFYRSWPKCRTERAFSERGVGWVYHYNLSKGVLP